MRRVLRRGSGRWWSRLRSAVRAVRQQRSCTAPSKTGCGRQGRTSVQSRGSGRSAGLGTRLGSEVFVAWPEPAELMGETRERSFERFVPSIRCVAQAGGASPRQRCHSSARHRGYVSAANVGGKLCMLGKRRLYVATGHRRAGKSRGRRGMLKPQKLRVVARIARGRSCADQALMSGATRVVIGWTAAHFCGRRGLAIAEISGNRMSVDPFLQARSRPSTLGNRVSKRRSYLPWPIGHILLGQTRLHRPIVRPLLSICICERCPT